MNKIVIILLLSFLSQIVIAETMSCHRNQSSYDCLVCNCYHETRGEKTLDGKIAVAKTVLTRSQSNGFPDTVCRVVYQPSQFSWTHDDIADNINAREPADRKALRECRAIANTAIDQGPNGLLYFHNTRIVTPAWARRVENCGRIEGHIFYALRGKCPRQLGANGRQGNQPQRPSGTAR